MREAVKVHCTVCGSVTVLSTVCGFERLVALSCKRRAFCRSCLGRRMNDTAVHLVEKVLPEVRIRQWVCTLPARSPSCSDSIRR
jgi:Transposase zinc-binding domain